MQKADYLLQLMKQRTDALIASDEELQQFLSRVRQKSLLVQVPYKPAAVRALYLADTRAFTRADADTRAFTRHRALDRAFDPALGSARARDLALARARARDFSLALARALDPALIHDCNLTIDPELKRLLQPLKDELPDLGKDEEEFEEWWEANGQAWTEQLRAVMIKHPNIVYHWRFSTQQQKLLEQYYEANKLLVDCLNSASNVTPAMRSHIEETLLLPIAEIEKRDTSLT